MSEHQHTNSIHFWLSEWQRSGAITPKEVIVDFSAALIGAVCKAFTGEIDTNSYLDACLKVSTNSVGAQLSRCFIRIDVAYLINSVSQWKEMPQITLNKRKIREFYLRTIGQIILSTHLLEVREILKNTFTTALREYEGFYCNKPSEVNHYERQKNI